jgi:hypothetical protein
MDRAIAVSPQERREVMSAEAGKSMGWTIVLVIFGVVALYCGPRSLALLVPAAALVWYGAAPLLNKSRN